MSLRYRQSRGAHLLSTASRPALMATQPPVQWTPEAASAVVRRPGREADQSTWLIIAEAYISTSPFLFVV